VNATALPPRSAPRNPAADARIAALLWSRLLLATIVVVFAPASWNPFVKQKRSAMTIPVMAAADAAVV